MSCGMKFHGRLLSGHQLRTHIHKIGLSRGGYKSCGMFCQKILTFLTASTIER